LLVSLVSGASLYAGGNYGGGNYAGVNFTGDLKCNVSAEAKSNGFLAFLYLFAPQSWITTWQAIPINGQECFIDTASNPANSAIFEADDVQQIQQLLQNNCQNGSVTQINSFLDAIEQTVDSLPSNFIADATTWGQQAQSLGNSLKASANGTINVKQGWGSNATRQAIAQFSSITADFTGKIANYSLADRQQIASAFPKLQPFISGDQSVEFLKEVTSLYQALGAGNLDTTSLRNITQQLKPTLQTIWQEYTTENAAGLQQAGKLVGQNLSQAGAAFGAQPGGPGDSFAPSSLSNQAMHSQNAQVNVAAGFGGVN